MEEFSMRIDTPMTRRETLRTLLRLSGCLAVGGIGFSNTVSPARAKSAPGKQRFLIEAIAQTEATTIRALTRSLFESAGGMQRFVSRGAVVVIKPNISWARRPELAATTHPEVLEAVIELCQEAGAKRVRIADNTIHDARRCFAITGVGQVARKTGADLIYPRSSLMRDMNLQGDRLDIWPVFEPLLEADTLINLPVAKHHSLSRLTLGMKNWIGGVGGSRWSLHQDINRSIVDLAQFFKPTVTLIDAVRIMTRNGPSGGSISDVQVKNTLILSDDPVAADARAALLFGRDPHKIGFIRLAQKQGLGTFDFEELAFRKVLV
jgi:uncharacterized protein (DUF362 family)